MDLTSPPHWIYWIIAGVAVIGLFITFWTLISKRIDKIKEESRWKGEINEHKSNVTTFMKEIKGKIDQIFSALYETL